MGKLNFMLYSFNCGQGSSMRSHFSTMRLRWISATVYRWRWLPFSWLYGFSFVWFDVYLCSVLTEISYFPCEDSLSKLQDLSYFSSKLVWPVFHKTTLAFFIRNGDQKETEYGIIDVNIPRKLTTLVQLIPFLHRIGKCYGRLKPEFFAMDGSIPYWRGICSVLILISTIFYRPQRSWGKVIFSQASVILSTGGRGMRGCQGSGVCVVAGGHAWLPGGVWLPGEHLWLLGGMHGCRGACVVARGHAWLLGGMHGCRGGMCGCQGACMVARGHAWLPGGMHGCWGVVCGCQGACVVARGYAWLPGGMHGCQGVCMVAGGHLWLPGGCALLPGDVHGIRWDTVNEWAVRILLECILVESCILGISLIPPANEVWGKVMFLHMSVILCNGAKGVSVWCHLLSVCLVPCSFQRGGLCPGGSPSGGLCSVGVSVQAGSLDRKPLRMVKRAVRILLECILARWTDSVFDWYYWLIVPRCSLAFSLQNVQTLWKLSVISFRVPTFSDWQNSILFPWFFQVFLVNFQVFFHYF